MAYDSTWHEVFYRKLIRLYPREFHEQLGESMEQTFHDLCRERRHAGKEVLHFALWTYAETLIGITKEPFRSMSTKNKLHAVAALLLVGALVFLGFVWWVNGKDDTWMYITSGLIVLISFTYLTPFKKDEDK